ncbi:MAG: hypothetical protein QM831_18245 [Kofleriaceae bacterium]
MKRIVWLVALVACGDKKAPDHDNAPAKPANDACGKKLDGFEPWFASLEAEKRSYEIDFGYTLQSIDREPAPVPKHSDAVEITATKTSVFDVSEHNHAEVKDGPITERLVAIHGMKASADEFQPAPDDLLRIDVDQQAPWSAVSTVIDAAAKAGYKQVVFAFTAKSKLVPPPGVDDTTKTEQAAREATDKLDALAKQCKKYEHAMMHMQDPKLSAADDAAKHAKEVAASFVECKCVPDPDEVKKQLWIDARWHQARPRVGVTIDPATVKIDLPPKTPWSEAHVKILAVAK